MEKGKIETTIDQVQMISNEYCIQVQTLLVDRFGSDLVFEDIADSHIVLLKQRDELIGFLTFIELSAPNLNSCFMDIIVTSVAMQEGASANLLYRLLAKFREYCVSKNKLRLCSTFRNQIWLGRDFLSRMYHVVKLGYYQNNPVYLFCLKSLVLKEVEQDRNRLITVLLDTFRLLKSNLKEEFGVWRKHFSLEYDYGRIDLRLKSSLRPIVDRFDCLYDFARGLPGFYIQPAFGVKI